MTLEITRERDLPNCMDGYKRRAIARRQITRWTSHYFPAFLIALSSCLSVDCTSATHLRALAGAVFISCTAPRAIAPRMASPYGGTGPVSGRAVSLLDFFVDAFFVAVLRAGIKTSVRDE